MLLRGKTTVKEIESSLTIYIQAAFALPISCNAMANASRYAGHQM